MKTTLATILIALSLCLSAAAKDKTTFDARASKSGEVNRLFYNFVSMTDLAADDIWTLVCIHEPCILFHEGDSITLTDHKTQRIRGLGDTEPRMTFKVCDLTLGVCNREAVTSTTMTVDEVIKRKCAETPGCEDAIQKK
jgi:hypothetical protein